MSIYEDIVEELGNLEAEKVVRKTVRYLQSLKDSLLSGDDSGLANAWDEFCVQVQLERSFYWDAYVLTAKQGIEGSLFGTPERSRILIWLLTDEAEDWLSMDNPSKAKPTVSDETLVDFLFDQYLMELASNYSNKRIESYLEDSY